MKIMLKARTTKRSKLKYDDLLSGFAFKFNLRRYSMGDFIEDGHVSARQAGTYTRSLFCST